MSHFYTLVLVNDKNILDEELARLMSRYSEHEEVDEYDDECYCKNSIASHAAREECEKKFGSFENIRASYWNEINSMIGPVKGNTEEHFKLREEAQETLKWEDHISAWVAYENECQKNHPMHNEFDPNCSECNGTGYYKSNYNPDSKWDWYQVGGRWSGILDSYDPGTY